MSESKLYAKMKYHMRRPFNLMPHKSCVSMLASKLEAKTILVLVFLSICCFWQIVSICSLYFNYPTNIFIDTNFDVFEQTLPALTFCTRIGTEHRGQNTSSDLFDMHLVNQTIQEISVSSFAREEEVVTDRYLSSLIESLSIYYYCFTINSQLKGK